MYRPRRHFDKQPKVVRNDNIGTEYSAVLDSDIYYMEDKAVKVHGGASLAEEDSKALAVIEGGGYRFARTFAKKESNEKNIYSRCLSMLSTLIEEDNLRGAWLSFMKSNQGAHDSVVVEHLSKAMPAQQSTTRDLNNRALKRAKIIQDHLEIEAISALKNCLYLDYGGNMWHNAAATGKHFKVGKIVVADVIDKRPDHPKNIDYIRINPHNPKLPIKDVGLVTMYMVAHHMDDKDLEACAHTISAACKKGAILVLREHDFKQTFEDTDDRKSIKDILDMCHLMHKEVWHSETEFNSQQSTDFDNLNTYYRPFVDYIAVFKKVGFELYKPPVILDDFRINIYNSGTIFFIKQDQI